MFCRKCGKEMPDDSVFCPKCGMAVAEVNNDEGRQTEQIDFHKTEESTQNATQNQKTKVPEYYSDQAREERRQKVEEVAIKSERKSKRVRTVLVCSIIGICVVVPLILYFSLRQFGYMKKSDGWYISHYYGSGIDVTIPTSHFGQAVVGIAHNAFEGSNIESIRFSSNSSSGKYKIEKQAFYDCRYLENVYFDARITEADISAYAFGNCTSLETVGFCSCSFNSTTQIQESKKIDNDEIDYDSMSEEEAREARALAVSKSLKALSISKFKFDKNAFAGCTKFNDD